MLDPSYAELRKLREENNPFSLMAKLLQRNGQHTSLTLFARREYEIHRYREGVKKAYWPEEKGLPGEKQKATRLPERWVI